MEFSSLPLYHLDPQNWHQSNGQQQVLASNNNHHEIVSELHQQPTNHGGHGGSTSSATKPNSMVDRARQAQLPLPEPGLKCPRCESTNTKFCYFNNYSLTQPRHFCKTCRRYWTRGGSLRNVPVGGGSRRTTKRSKGRSTSVGGSSSSISISSGGSSSRSPATVSITNSGHLAGNNSYSTSSFLNAHHLQNSPLLQLPFLPSLHNLGNSSNPSSIGLNLLGAGGAEMEFPNLLASFDGLGRINGTHPFDNSTNGNVELLGGRQIGHHYLESKPSMDIHSGSTRIEDARRMHLGKDFGSVQGSTHERNQFNWNNNVWTSSDLSNFSSPS